MGFDVPHEEKKMKITSLKVLVFVAMEFVRIFRFAGKMAKKEIWIKWSDVEKNHLLDLWSVKCFWCVVLIECSQFFYNVFKLMFQRPYFGQENEK